MLEKGTSFHVGSWIFVADGSSSFESRPIDQSTPEVSEAASHHELDNFIDQLEEVGFSALNNKIRIQLEFGEIKTKTLSELEEDLERLLENTKQETPMDGRVLSSSCIHFAEPSLRKKKVKNQFQENYSQKEAVRRHFFQTSITSMKKSNTASS